MRHLRPNIALVAFSVVAFSVVAFSVVALSVSASSSNSSSSDSGQKYEASYHAATYNQFLANYQYNPDYRHLPLGQKQNLAKKQADLYTQCHMQAIGLYPKKVLKKGHEVANSGGTYAEVRHAMNELLKQKVEAGGKQRQETIAVLKKVTAQTTACVNKGN